MCQSIGLIHTGHVIVTTSATACDRSSVLIDEIVVMASQISVGIKVDTGTVSSRWLSERTGRSYEEKK